jgi:hypothetical protein
MYNIKGKKKIYIKNLPFIPSSNAPLASPRTSSSSSSE